MNRYTILGLELSGKTYADTIVEIVDLAKKRTPSFVCFTNVHMTIEAYDDKSFLNQVNAAHFACADGMPLVKAVGLKYRKNIERVAGMDMMPSLLKEAEKNQLKVFFYGTTDEILEKIKHKALLEHPNLQIVGTFSPPFRPISPEEKKEQQELIVKSEAQLVFVALGCPKQEKWMAENTAHLPAVLLGVGGAFPVYVDMQKRAPKWVRDFSLEWLYRLVQDPKRLFKRYFYTNSKFLYLFFKEYLFNRNSLAK